MPTTSLRCPSCAHILLTIDLPLPPATLAVGAPHDVDAPLLLRIPEAARLLDVSRTTMYQLVGRGEVPMLRIGRSVRIARATLERLAKHGL